jgi:hypothetical protein
MTTDGFPTQRARTASSSGARRKKRHPAGASRVLAAGVATASTFGLVAVLGSQPSVGEVQTVAAANAVAPVTTSAPTTAPAPVVVVRRSYVQVDGGTPAATSSPTPSGSAGRAQAPVTSTPRRSAPVTRSSSS